LNSEAASLARRDLRRGTGPSHEYVMAYKAAKHAWRAYWDAMDAGGRRVWRHGSVLWIEHRGGESRERRCRVSPRPKKPAAKGPGRGGWSGAPLVDNCGADVVEEAMRRMDGAKGGPM
jgi:hypothetical protein